MTIQTACALGVLLTTLAFTVCGAYQLFAAWKASLPSRNADELFLAISRSKTCAGLYFVASVVLLASFSGIKALLLLKGLLVDTPLTLAAFGAAEGGSVAGHLGLGGLMLAALAVFAGFRYLKTTHYIQVLFAFRKQLGLESRFTSS